MIVLLITQDENNPANNKDDNNLLQRTFNNPRATQCSTIHHCDCNWAHNRLPIGNTEPPVMHHNINEY